MAFDRSETTSTNRQKKKICQRFAKLKEVFATAQADTKHHI
jgi:hypothetical protein